MFVPKNIDQSRYSKQYVNLESNDTKFVVVGGGTAGWLTALTLKYYYPDVHVKLIESSEIGILGAGEGTTPQIISLLEQLGITLPEIFINANGTIKNGIKFTNWHGDKTHYYHGFGNVSDLCLLSQTRVNQTIPLIVAEKAAQGQSLDDIDFTAAISELNATKFTVSTQLKNKTANNTTHFNSLGQYSIHFNANMLADFLKAVGVQRKIECVDGIVNKINTDENGYITSLDLNHERTIKCDFVFDCTGFKRLIIGNFYKAKFKSYKQHLPVNTAIPFQHKYESDTSPIPPYTEAIAMKYGWMWKIPVKNRFGCGYVFDKNQISMEDAKKEIDQFMGYEVEVPKTFSFEAGVYETPWIKNCVALGLSSGFVEPLEATSIWVTINSLHWLSNSNAGMVYRNPYIIEAYNKSVERINDQVLEFLYFHYITNRTDTTFWKDFLTYTKVPDGLLELVKTRNLSLIDDEKYQFNFFNPMSYYAVGLGLNFYDKVTAQNLFNSINYGNRKQQYFYSKKRFVQNLKLTLTACIDHRSYLDYTSNS